MDAETLKWASSLGVGGILAGLMFLLYRKDATRWAESETKRGDTMTDLVKETTAAVTNNTAAVHRLTDYIIKNGHKS